MILDALLEKKRDYFKDSNEPVSWRQVLEETFCEILIPILFGKLREGVKANSSLLKFRQQSTTNGATYQMTITEELLLRNIGRTYPGWDSMSAFKEYAGADGIPVAMRIFMKRELKEVFTKLGNYCISKQLVTSFHSDIKMESNLCYCINIAVSGPLELEKNDN